MNILTFHASSLLVLTRVKQFWARAISILLGLTTVSQIWHGSVSRALHLEIASWEWIFIPSFMWVVMVFNSMVMNSMVLNHDLHGKTCPYHGVKFLIFPDRLNVGTSDMGLDTHISVETSIHIHMLSGRAGCNVSEQRHWMIIIPTYNIGKLICPKINQWNVWPY